MKKILLFEEEFPLAKEIREGILLRKPDSIFHSAATYKDAFALANKNDYDVIVIDVVIPFTTEDKQVNNKLVDPYSTGIVFKNHLLEEGINNPKLYLFTSRSNLTESDKSGTVAVIEKPKRPSEIVKTIFDE